MPHLDVVAAVRGHASVSQAGGLAVHGLGPGPGQLNARARRTGAHGGIRGRGGAHI